MRSPFQFVAIAMLAMSVCSQAKDTAAPTCSEYFGIVEYDPAIPGLFVAKMSDPQAKWFAKRGPKEFPGLCLSLEKARYLIVWTVATESWKAQETVHRSAQVNTSTVGQQDGTFQVSDTYGAMARGDYSGTFSGNSTSTISYDETVPVARAADHCSIYVVKAQGNTIADDIRSKTAQPQVIYTHETFRPQVTQDGDQSAAVIGRIFRREPTVGALDGSLRFVFEHGAQAQTLAVFTTASGKYMTNGEPKAGSTHTGPEAAQTLPTNHDSAQRTNLGAATAMVSFSSDPTGADIYVDGNFMGSTPSQIQIPVGLRTVRIESKGRKTWNRTINLTASSTISLKAVLEAEHSG